MGKPSKKTNNKKKRRKQPQTAKNTNQTEGVLSNHNFVSQAGPGCYVARRDLTPSLPDWMLEWEDVDPSDFDAGDEVPELAMDPDEKTLSVCNTRRDQQSLIAYITVYSQPLRGRHGKRLEQGVTINNQGVSRHCITFIVLCPPMVFAHLCHVDVSDDVNLFTDVEIESDVQVWNQHPNPSDHHMGAPYLGFPLQCQGDNDKDGFMCTQGVGGQLTHFFCGNLHAIDFRCPVGTPLLAVADGEVVQAQDHNTLTGIAVTNLFEWNSIMLKLDTPTTPTTNSNNDSENNIDANDASGKDGQKSNSTTNHHQEDERRPSLYVEYVHIQKSFVKVGDRVTKGQVIGESGSVGFSPEPHLHFAAYRSNDDTAPTVQVHFQSAFSGYSSNDSRNEPELFLPRAGYYYNANGQVKDI